MKFQLMSDLHLEFENTFRPKNCGADVLILSGDICVAEYFCRGELSPKKKVSNEFYNFLFHCSQEFKHVIYVLGNHEHYYGYIDTSVDVMRSVCRNIPNIHILDKEFIDIDDTRFVGGTMWTNINKMDPIAEMTIKNAMNDFRMIQWSKNYHKFSPLDSAHIHSETLVKFGEYMNHDKIVVCSHHAPSSLSVHEKYKNSRDHYINYAYHSVLDNFILEHPQIKCWTHGHVHDNFDYMIGDTRVICNPRGYNDENPSFSPNNVYEV